MFHTASGAVRRESWILNDLLTIFSCHDCRYSKSYWLMWSSGTAGFSICHLSLNWMLSTINWKRMPSSIYSRLNTALTMEVSWHMPAISAVIPSSDTCTHLVNIIYIRYMYTSGKHNLYQIHVRIYHFWVDWPFNCHMRCESNVLNLVNYKIVLYSHIRPV